VTILVDPGPMRRYKRRVWPLVFWGALAMVALAFAGLQERERRRVLALYEPILSREGPVFEKDSERGELDEQMETARRARDGGLGVAGVLLLAPALLRMSVRLRRGG
jgi:hypothetical protein